MKTQQLFPFVWLFLSEIFGFGHKYFKMIYFTICYRKVTDLQYTVNGGFLILSSDRM